MLRDYRVTTWASKIGVIDYQDVLDLSEFDSDYEILCLKPAGRVVLQSLLSFQDEYFNRWTNFPSLRVKDQLVAETTEALGCPMACREDIQAINTTLQGISLTLQEIRDRFGPAETDVNQRLLDIETAISELDTNLAGLGFPDILDQIEPILNGVGVILGAPIVPIP